MSAAPSYVTSYTNQTVAQVLLLYLAREGVTTIFGIPGAGIANLLVELKNQRDHFNTSSAATKPAPRIWPTAISEPRARSASSWSRQDLAQPMPSRAR